MYQELHRWDECIAVAEAKVQGLSFPSVRIWIHQFQKSAFVRKLLESK